MNKSKNPQDHWINRMGEEPRRPEKQVVVAKEGCFLQTLNFGCLVLAILVIVITLAILFNV